MTDPTKGLRLSFEPGFTGLKFTAGDGAYPEDNGPTDMAYINSLIEADERRREKSAAEPPVDPWEAKMLGKALVPWDGSPEAVTHAVSGHIPLPAEKLAPQPRHLPINRALVHALSFCVIPLPEGSVIAENRSPDAVVVTVDRATVKSA